jgi:hypothetical protein
MSAMKKRTFCILCQFLKNHRIDGIFLMQQYLCENAQRNKNFRRRTRRTRKSIFEKVWREKAEKLKAVHLSEGGLEGQRPSSCAAGATSPHKPSKFPALNAPERAVVVLCANKIDFRVRRKVGVFPPYGGETPTLSNHSL